jgi:prepilin-type N-terminal cleavage/methylation domain-containing protein
MASSNGYQPQPQRGFSLIELMTTLGIVAILASKFLQGFVVVVVIHGGGLEGVKIK